MYHALLFCSKQVHRGKGSRPTNVILNSSIPTHCCLSSYHISVVNSLPYPPRETIHIFSELTKLYHAHPYSPLMSFIPFTWRKVATRIHFLNPYSHLLNSHALILLNLHVLSFIYHYFPWQRKIDDAGSCGPENHTFANNL